MEAFGREGGQRKKSNVQINKMIPFMLALRQKVKCSS